MLGACPQLWLPDSPRWVLLSGRGRAAAQAAVEKLRGRFAAQEVIDAEVDQMVATTSTGKPSASKDPAPEDHLLCVLSAWSSRRGAKYPK